MQTKKWLWISIGMFFVPELLFAFLISTFLFFFGIELQYPTRDWIMNEYLYSNDIFVFFALAIEILGVFGLLVYNIKFNARKTGHFFSGILSLIFIFLIFIFYVGFTMRNGIGF